jgi:hypothetical protein
MPPQYVSMYPLDHKLTLFMYAFTAPILGDNVYSKTEVHERIKAITKVPEDRIFLHASHMSFYVSVRCSRSRLPFLTVSQRYKKTGMSKRFRLGITSPLPRDFLKICMDMGIGARLDRREVMGGLFADGVPYKELPDVEGKWLC